MPAPRCDSDVTPARRRGQALTDQTQAQSPQLTSSRSRHGLSHGPDLARSPGTGGTQAIVTQNASFWGRDLSWRCLGEKCNWKMDSFVLILAPRNQGNSGAKAGGEGCFALPASSWARTPCSRHTGTCTAACSGTARRRGGTVSDSSRGISAAFPILSPHASWPAAQGWP